MILVSRPNSHPAPTALLLSMHFLVFQFEIRPLRALPHTVKCPNTKSGKRQSDHPALSLSLLHLIAGIAGRSVRSGRLNMAGVPTPHDNDSAPD